jgi:hypothetical protein
VEISDGGEGVRVAGPHLHTFDLDGGGLAGGLAAGRPEGDASDQECDG